MKKAVQILAAAVLAIPLVVSAGTASEASGHRGYGGSYAHGKQDFRGPSHLKRQYWSGRKFYRDSSKHRFSRFGFYRNNGYWRR